MSTSAVNDDVRACLELGVQAAEAYKRPDLGDRLHHLVSHIGDPDVQVVVVGEFKQGKSSLINALVNAKICPVDDDIATAVPTVLRHGDEKQAWAVVAPVTDGAPPPEGSEERRPIPFEQVPAYATELGGVDHTIHVKGVEIELPRKLLSEGLVLVDTPGVGGLGSAHATAALGALSVADAALFVSDASQEYTRAEMDFLAQAQDLCPKVVCLMTKTDFYPAWRRVLEINNGHLQRLGFDIPIIPVSSMLRAEAVRRNDRDLNRESGFPDLVRNLTSDIVAGANARERDRAKATIINVCDQLSGQFEAELAALNDPERANELLEQLGEAKRKADTLRSQVAKWSTTLNDGVSDLTSDIEFDFRQRMRAITQEGDAAIENSDPLDTWAEFEPWLVNRLSHEVVSNYRYMTERAAALSADVGTHFDSDGDHLLGDLDIHNPTSVLEGVSVEPTVDLTETTAGKKGLTVLRGSYSGMLMFGLLGGMVAVAAPVVPFVAPAAGAIFARNALKDEKARELARRRAEARNSMRRYCDEVNFQVTKDSRDTMRRVQRQLRDHYSARAEELHKSTTENLKAAQEAAKVGATEKAGRLRDIEAELGRIRGLRTRAEQLPAISPTAQAAQGAPAAASAGASGSP